MECLKFTPNSEFLISLGDPNDRGLFVWDWRNGVKLSSNKLSKPVTTIAMSPDSDIFVTGGYQHLKFWSLDPATGRPITVRPAGSNESIMESKTAELAKVKLSIFVGVAIYNSKVFALATDGHIYVYDKQRKLVKWMNIKVTRAFSLQASNDRLFCACADGIVRVFATETLQHLLTLSKPPPLGSTNIKSGISKIKIPQGKESKFADVVACYIDEQNQRAVTLYSDRMMFIWDIKKFDQITVYRTFMSHSGPIHEIQVVPNNTMIGF